MKIILICYTTFLLSLYVAHKSMCKYNGAIYVISRYIGASHKVYRKHTCDIFSGVSSGRMQTLLYAARVHFVRI